jgi:outer membrane protein assembly factor BamB
MMVARYAMLVAVLLFASVSMTSGSIDWPQWQGPHRTGASSESGLLKSWPPSGPPRTWSIKGLGSGYGTVAMQADRIYVQGTENGKSVVFALNRGNGSTVWSQALGSSLDQDRGGGPRGTPTIDGVRIFALTEAGDLACLRARDGSIAWSRNILRDFGGQNINWHISESPLVDGNRLVIMPGGPDAGLVALDKMTGKTIWKTEGLSDRAGYASSIVRDVHGVRTIMTFTASAAVGVRATDGALLWRYQPVANRTANITTPLFHDNKVFYTSAYGTGCALLNLVPSGNQAIDAREIYFSREMMNHHGGVVLVDKHLYGFSNAILTCMEFATGKPVWKDRSVGKGSVTYADGNLYLLSENNIAGLAVATPEGYREKGRFEIPDQGLPSWAHPVVCDGKLYIRNQDLLLCYDIRSEAPLTPAD